MATSLNASLNVTLNPQSLNQASKQVGQALGRITGQASEFQKSLDASTARVFAFGATTAVLNGVSQSFRKLVSATIEVEKRLIEVNSIFQATDATFNKFRNSIFRVAKDTGQSFNTVAEGAAELARQGLSAEETASRLKSALVLTRISGLDAEKSVKALTAAINGFQSAGLSHTEIINKMVAVDTAFAVSAQDLAEAFSRAGSTAEDAGVSFDQLLALVTAVEQKTARGGAVIGNAFKSIFTRLQRGTTISELQELGVAIDATQTGVQKLQALSGAIENIADPTVVSKIKELAGGVFQINVVSAALKDLGSDTGIFAKAAKTASEATNEAFEKNAALSESLSSQINVLVVGLTSLAEKIGGITFGPLLENLVGIATTFTEFLDKALDPDKGNMFVKGFFKAIGSFLGGPAIVIFTAAFAKISQLIGRFAVEGLKSLFTIGTQTEKIRNVESSIVSLLQRDENLRNAILSSTLSQAQKEQLVLTAIRNENALLKQQAALMRQIATATFARGVRANPAGGFRGRFNAGFRAEEAEARMLGAPAGVKGRMSKGTIGGRKFIMNNHETEIPNFAGGDSAVIPHYAGGFVPNYSRRNLETVIANRSGRQTPEAIANARRKLAEMDRRAEEKANRARLPLSGSGKALLIPRLNFVGKIKKGTKGSFMKGKTSIPYELTSGIHIRGPKIPRSVDDISDPQDEQLRTNIFKDVVKNAKAFANTLFPVTGRGVSDSKIKRQLLKQGGGKGALHAVIGAGFEAAVMAGLDLSPAKRKDGGDFDVRGGQVNNLADIQGLFGLAASINLMDFKATASAGGKSSFVKKIANEKFKNNTANMLSALGRRKAAGHIPNFTLGARGVPTSMMRVHKDDKGEPVAVTNLRDEPNGLQDAIKRERQGIGMFASGFIPNYNLLPQGITNVRQLPSSGAQMSNQSAAAAAANINKLGKSAEKAAVKVKSTGDKSIHLMGGLFALQTAFGMLTAKTQERVFQAQEEEQTRIEEITARKVSITEKLKEIREVKKQTNAVQDSTRKLEQFADTMTIVMTTMMAMQTLNSLTGGGLGRVAGRAFNSRAMGRMGFGAVGRDRFKSRMSGRSMGGTATSLKDVNRGLALRGGVRTLGGIGTVIGGGLMIGDALSTSGTLRERQASIGRTGAGVGGGILGGMATGAAVGTLGAGPIGTAIGAIVGGVAGAFAGDAMASGLTEDAKQKDLKTIKEVDDSVLRGLSRDQFTERANLVGKLKARGVSALDFDMASAEDQKKMLQLDETQEGVDAANKAALDYSAALEKVTAITLGEGFNLFSPRKKEEALRKAQAELLKKRNVLLGKSKESEAENLKFLAELRQETEKLARARGELAERLKQTGIQTDADTADRSAKEFAAFSDMEALKGTFKGMPNEFALNTMIGGGKALSEANTLQALQKQGDNVLKLAERLGTNDTTNIDPLKRSMAKIEEDLASGGKDLRDSVRKGAIFFQTTMRSIAEEQKRTQSQLNEVSSSIIAKAQTIIRARVAGELPNMDALGRDLTATGGLLTKFEASKKEGSDVEFTGRDMSRLQNMLAELNALDLKGKLDITEGQALAAVMGRPLEDLARILADLKMDTIMSPAEREAAALPEASPADQAKLAVAEKIREVTEAEIAQQQALITKRDGLAVAMDKATQMYNALAELNVKDEDGQNIVTAMKDFSTKLETAGNSLAGLENFSDTFVDSTLKTTELVTSVTNLNEGAIGAIKDLTTEVGKLKESVATMKSKFGG